MWRRLAVVVCVASGLDFMKPSYWKQQAQTARLLGSLSRGSKVLEVDAVDGAKNLYYLPFGCSVTQWTSAVEAGKDRGPLNVAAQKLGLTVDVARCRESKGTPRLAPASFDACFGIGAVGRAGNVESAVTLVDTALRALKPEGRYYFVEKNPNLVVPLFDEVVDGCQQLIHAYEASVEDDAVVGYFSVPPLDQRTQGTGMGGSLPASTTKRRRR